MKLSLLLKFALGFLSLSLGAIGLLVPVWPTTPFVLVAVGCFSATPSVQARILNVKFFRDYYEGYTTGQGLRHSTVAVSLAFLWGTLALSAFLVKRPVIIAFLLLVGIAVTIHILWISKSKTQRKSVRRRCGDD